MSRAAAANAPALPPVAVALMPALPSNAPAPSTSWTTYTKCAAARCSWSDPAAHLYVSELTLDHPKRMFDLAWMMALRRSSRMVRSSAVCSCPAVCVCPAASQCSRARRPWRRGAGWRPGNRHRPRLRFPRRAVRCGPDHIADAAGAAAHGMHQARVGIHADVGLIGRCTLIALLALPHLRVAFSRAVRGRIGRGDQLGVHHCVGAQQRPLALISSLMSSRICGASCVKQHIGASYADLP
ncbi:hypothetical protein DFQ15_1201 [Xylophilus ampelinus]|uniref:Uncharacterized protein n=1 Tax=Xylophilus ampelinus TaxID=54067 RepID=A0A318SDG4_9BURK|nr:hypothetical protein DFQ15_1201 [Xylophilus ampelinus]